MLTVTFDDRQVRRMLKGLGDDIANQSLREAVNKAAAKGNTEMKRRISREFNLRAGDVANQLMARKASKSFSVVTAEILAQPKVRGRRARNVIEFMERKVSLAEARRRRKSGTLKDLRFEIRRGRKVMIPGSFVLTANRGTFVAQRVPGSVAPSRSKYAGTKHAEQIKAVQTIDVPQMFNTKRIALEVIRNLETKLLPEELQRAIAYALKRFGK